MKKILVTADYLSTGLKDFDGDWLNPERFELPEYLWKKIRDWVDSYKSIIPLDMHSRLKLKNDIKDLDTEGIEIAKEISNLKQGFTVIYYSEGLLKYINIEQISK